MPQKYIITTLLLLLVVAIGSAFVPSCSTRCVRPVANHGIFASPGSEDEFDLEELNRRIQDLSDPYGKLFLTNEWDQRPKPSHVHIILFSPDTADEGVHTIEYPIGSGSNVILAFESAAECASFVTVLKSQNFYNPIPQPMELEGLEEYCKELGVLVQVVPRGMDLLPPASVVDQISHNPNLTQEKNQLNDLFEKSSSDSEKGATGIQVDGLSGTWD